MTSAAPPFIVRCPSCDTGFPIDPGKVAAAGTPAICSNCLRVFTVRTPVETAEAWTAPALLPMGPRPPAVALDAPAEFGEEIEVESETLLELGVAPPTADEVPEAPAPSPAPPSFEDLTSLASEAMADPTASPQEAGSDGSGRTVASGADRFGRRDPMDRARHLARVLVSDIIAYYPERYRESFEQGTLQDDFRTEVEKSWKEYVDQVGLEMAESTPFFNEALNEVLGKGKHAF